MIARVRLNNKIIQGVVGPEGIFSCPEMNFAAPIENLDIALPCSPSKIVLAGLNYVSHARELGMEIPADPIIFLKPPSSLLPHNGKIILPGQSRQVDYEAEIAVVIDKQAKAISPGEAQDYIRGITCLNDVTARDLQKKDGQWTRAKSFDTFCPVGPFIAPFDLSSEIKVRAILNNKIAQEGSSNDMIFPIPKLISYISHIMTLHPGDIVSTGTPPGIGKLKSGDKICIEIEGIMKLCNFVV